MRLYFHSRDRIPGESQYLNIDTASENYNFNIYPEARYIEVSREDLDAIYKECDFNCYWHEDDLSADHYETKTQTGESDHPTTIEVKVDKATTHPKTFETHVEVSEGKTPTTIEVPVHKKPARTIEIPVSIHDDEQGAR